MKTQFREFVFDSSSCHLWQDGEQIELRPKTALLLQHLLRHPGRISVKSDLIDAVWGHEHVEDQALFQLISELRQQLGNKDCIRTFPNRGYQWAWPAEPVEDVRVWPFAAAAAWIAVAFAVAIMVTQFDRSELIPAHPVVAVSPADNAMMRAVEARANGDLAEAVTWLQAAIVERPSFASAKLELAETLRMQGEMIKAQGYAYDALSDARLVGDQYTEVVAHLLLSRLRWQQGDLTGALQLNSAAGQMARDRQYSCAAQLAGSLDRLLLAALVSPNPTVNANPEPELPELSAQSLLAGCDGTSANAAGETMQRTAMRSLVSIKTSA